MIWEYLSIYAERNNGTETFVARNYPESGNRIDEDTLLKKLGAEGWELVAVVPAYQYNNASGIHHQLYFKRSNKPTRITRSL